MGCGLSAPPRVTQDVFFMNGEEEDRLEGNTLEDVASASNPGPIEEVQSTYKDWREVVSFHTFVESEEHPTIFEYEFIKPIGRGAQAEVFEVHNTDTAIIYAAKVYDKAFLYRTCLGDQEPPIQKIAKEISIMSNLRHPNTIGLVEVLDDDITNSIIIIQDFATNGPLLPQQIKTKPFTEEKAKDVFFQIACGVDYIHSHNIAHRDIKPENILTFSDGRVAVGDFSASVILDTSDQMLEDTDGTPAYYSPEQCTGQPYRAKPADIWQCGVTLYVLLMGHLPFYSTSEDGFFLSQFFKIAQMIINDPIVFDENINLSDNAKDLILKCMEKDPSKRITVEQILEHPWFEGREPPSDDDVSDDEIVSGLPLISEE